MQPNLEMLAIVADGLGELLRECVFVGGATTILYLDSGAAEPRPTEDVDCVIEIATRTQYEALQDRLRSIGFTHDSRPKAPLCRWTYSGVTVDVMPTDDRILGFTNRWYKDGMKNRESKLLPSGQTIAVFPLSFFIASKLEAYRSRGQNEPRLSSDIEDILYVLDGTAEPLSAIRRSPKNVQTYLAESFAELLQNRDFTEALDVHLGREGIERVERVRGILSEVTKGVR